MKGDRQKQVDGEELDATVEPLLRAARIPGAAVAIVSGGRLILAKGYGRRDMKANLPMTADTCYPIGSTTKAITATLIGMMVDEGRLAWDAPVQTYLPWFRLYDCNISAQVTLRDLLAMRTGLPRHEWTWIGDSIGRASLVERLKHLEPTAGFRERFQYSNLTSAAAGHIAEVVSGRSWEDLVQQRILTPLGMDRTGFARPTAGRFNLSYHEGGIRELQVNQPHSIEVLGPAGGSINSTVEDMARWMSFNLGSGTWQGRKLIESQTLAEVQAPLIAARGDATCPTPGAAYAMCWFVDHYNGRPRTSHVGYIHDVSSAVMLFPEDGMGIVCFTNFGAARLARVIGQYALDWVMGFKPEQTVEEQLLQYEAKIAATRESIASVPRARETTPSHPLDDYAGTYEDPGYGKITIRRDGRELQLCRGELILPLRHWHYDGWVAANAESFPLEVFPLDERHAFDGGSRILFDSNADGEIAAVSIRLEPAVAAIRFEKLSRRPVVQ